MMSSKTIYFLFGLLPYHIFERVGNNYTGESVFRNLLKSSGLIGKDSTIGSFMPEAPLKSICFIGLTYYDYFYHGGIQNVSNEME
jgi:hypothetical protein